MTESLFAFLLAAGWPLGLLVAANGAAALTAVVHVVAAFRDRRSARRDDDRPLPGTLMLEAAEQQGPSAGLAGTVIGLIMAFSARASGEDLEAGLAVSLTTTLAGLTLMWIGWSARLVARGLRAADGAA